MVASGQMPTLVKMFCYTYVTSPSSSSGGSLLDFGLEEPSKEVVLFLIEAMKEGGQVKVTLKTEAANAQSSLDEMRRLIG